MFHNRISLFRTLLVSLSFGTLTAVTNAAHSGVQPALLIEDVRLADPSQPGISGPTSVLIRSGRIDAIGPSSNLEIPSDALRVSGTGKFLIPGLADMHVHLDYFGEAAPPLLLANGITFVRDMGGDPAVISSLREAIEQGEIPGPRIQAAGPIFESRRWLNAVREIMEEPLQFRMPYTTAYEAREWVQMIQPLEPDLIKVRNFPDMAGYEGVIEGASEHGLRVGGHAPWSWPLVETVRAGQQSLEHLPLLAFDPEEEVESARADLADEMLRQGTFFVPTIIAMQGRLYDEPELREMLERPDARRRCLPASVMRKWQQELDSREGESNDFDWPPLIQRSLEHVRALHEAGVPMVTGTDLAVQQVYPGSSIHEELAFFVDEIGMTPREALAAATVNAAKLAGLSEEQGRIEVGLRADLVLLDEDPFANIGAVSAVHAVVFDGALHDEEDFRAWKETVAATKDEERNFAYPGAWHDAPVTAESQELLGAYYLAKGEYSRAVPYYRTARDLDPTHTDHYTTGVLLGLINDLYPPASNGTFDEVWAEADPVLERQIENSRRLDLAARLAALTTEIGAPDKRPWGIITSLDTASLSEDETNLYHELMTVYCLEIEPNPTRALEHRKSTLPKGWEEQADLLNNLAWWCFENRIALPEARRLAESAIRLANNDRVKVRSMDTLAEIAILEGNIDEALELMESVLTIDSHEYFQKQLVRFQELKSGNQ